MIELYHGDCLQELYKVADKSVSLVLADLPYGTTARNTWDKKIPMKPLWEHFIRVLLLFGVRCLFQLNWFNLILIGLDMNG